MESGGNKTSIEEIKEGTFGGTYFRNIYSGVRLSDTKRYEKDQMT